MDSIHVVSEAEKFISRQFNKKLTIDEDANLHIYELDYYESGLNDIESVYDGERMIGNIKFKRQYVTSQGQDPFMFTLHTNLRDSTFFDEDLKATIAIVHGFGENSDIFLETAIQFALNGFDVHLIDLKGYGMSGSPRMSKLGIQDYHRDVTALLQQANPQLPLFIYGHSMGGLTVLTYLINNPQLNITGVVLSAPYLGANDRQGLNEPKKMAIKLLAPHLEEFLINPGIPTHLVSSDKRVFREFLVNRKNIPFMSLGLIKSIIEFQDDIPYNLKGFKYPILMMMAEHEYLVNNKQSKMVYDKLGSKIKEQVVFKGQYHELQKEPAKDQIHSKVLMHISALLKNRNQLKPFGVLKESTVYYGYHKIRKQGLSLKKIAILGVIVYILIGLLLSKVLFPQKYSQMKVIAKWPLLLLIKLLLPQHGKK